MVSEHDPFNAADTWHNGRLMLGVLHYVMQRSQRTGVEAIQWVQLGMCAPLQITLTQNHNETDRDRTDVLHNGANTCARTLYRSRVSNYLPVSSPHEGDRLMV